MSKILKEEVDTFSNEDKFNKEQVNNEKLQSVSPGLNSKTLRIVEKACLTKEEVLHDKS